MVMAPIASTGLVAWVVVGAQAGGVALTKSEDNDVGFRDWLGHGTQTSDRISIGTEGPLYLFDEEKVTFFANGR